jgi:hypothetical protein
LRWFATDLSGRVSCRRSRESEARPDALTENGSDRGVE